MDYIRDILSEIGYNLQDYGKEYRARPIYRNSDNNTVLRIRKENGSWTDFKHSVGGSFEELIKISLNLKSIDEAKKFLKDKNHTNKCYRILDETFLYLHEIFKAVPLFILGFYCVI